MIVASRLYMPDEFFAKLNGHSAFHNLVIEANQKTSIHRSILAIEANQKTKIISVPYWQLKRTKKREKKSNIGR